MSTANSRIAPLSLPILVALALVAASTWSQTAEQSPPTTTVAAEEAAAPAPDAGDCCCADEECACCGEAAATECPGCGCCGSGPAVQGAAPQGGRGMGPGKGCMMHGMRGDPPGAGMGAGGRGLMHTAMSLVHQRENIERTVEEIPGGIRTHTVVTTDDPALTARLVEHVEGMAGLMERGGRVRDWDPLFSELFDHAAAITLEIEEIPGGVLVVETSKDPEVAKLIRAHAIKVNEFLARGHGAVHETTPIPEDYRRPGSSETKE